MENSQKSSPENIDNYQQDVRIKSEEIRNPDTFLRLIEFEENNSADDNPGRQVEMEDQ